ncbi:MAG: 5'-deoxynucleotidase, partial [Saccharofermentanales bacterium]
MKNAFFAMVSRMRYINRWSLMRNTRTENIEEHSLQVAILAHAIAVIRNRYFSSDDAGNLRIAVSPDRVAVLAIYHDTDEILVGDMPTPVKYFNPEIERVLKSIETDAVDKRTGMLPEELRQEYGTLLAPDRSDPVVAESMR